MALKSMSMTPTLTEKFFTVRTKRGTGWAFAVTFVFLVLVALHHANRVIMRLATIMSVSIEM